MCRILHAGPKYKQQVILHVVFGELITQKPITVAALSNAWVLDRSLAGIVCSNPAGGMDVCLV
jgi:hypothetical protein